MAVEEEVLGGRKREGRRRKGRTGAGSANGRRRGQRSWRGSGPRCFARGCCATIKPRARRRLFRLSRTKPERVLSRRRHGTGLGSWWIVQSGRGGGRGVPHSEFERQLN
eukprot:5037640-Pyramimonas_sp.AAC.1